jgi:hypothetical protein
MVSVGDINPFASMGGGGGLFGGSFAQILLIGLISLFIIGAIGFLIWTKSIKKTYWIKIHVFRLIGNVPTRVAIYDACEVPFGRAGDRLWKVAGAGLMGKLKPIKWLPVGKIQTSAREFWYYIREDGEWINFQMADLDVVSKIAGVKYTNEDMRLQRLATERLLEQRLMEKSFWEKWGQTIVMVIFFLVIAVCMVIIFYQFSKLVTEIGNVVRIQEETSKILLKVFGENYATGGATGGAEGLVPAT